MTNLADGEFLGLHSCNGLCCIAFKLSDGALLFLVYNPTTQQCRRIPENYVYNPATRSYRLIPQTTIGKGNHFLEPYEFEALNIVFDPSKSDHYKIVCVGLWNGRCCWISVYASETEVWRDMTDFVDVLIGPYIYFRNGVLWNGHLHWISQQKSILCLDSDNMCLKWDAPSLPYPFDDEQWDIWFFGDSGGCLCVVEVIDPQGVLFDVFELDG